MTAQVQIGKKVIEFNGVDLPLVSITDETDSGVAYYCEAPAGSLSSDPVWRISKAYSPTPGVSVLTWAGTGEFDQIADDRKTLQYMQVIGQ